MRWDVSRNVYVAPIPVGMNVESAPITVELRAGGRRHRGSVHMHGRRGHGGRAVVVVDRPSPHVTVEVDRPVRDPRVVVEVNAPRPPSIEVRVGHPSPRADVHIHTDNGRHRGHGKHRKVRGHGMGGMRGRRH
jgi:hypothetical protein